MSMGQACSDKGHRAAGAWVVTDRQCNYSKFNGSRYAPSDYSEVRCLQCRSVWRTKAKYVGTLRDARVEDKA